jgi:hypothetical protein
LGGKKKERKTEGKKERRKEKKKSGERVDRALQLVGSGIRCVNLSASLVTTAMINTHV